MHPSLLLLFLISTITVASSDLASSDLASSPTSPPTVYDLLPKYGLPQGLLPDSVTSYTLAGNGSFVVDLVGPCYVQFDSYLVYYEPRITGTLKMGGIRDLDGIEVRKFFLWLDVDEIKVDLPPSEYIYFEVGWITRKIKVDEFRTVHSCEEGRLVSGFEIANRADEKLAKLPSCGQTAQTNMLSLFEHMEKDSTFSKVEIVWDLCSEMESMEEERDLEGDGVG